MLSLLTAVAHADEAARVRAVVEPLIVTLMSQSSIPGMAVAVTARGHAYAPNFGVAARKPVGP